MSTTARFLTSRQFADSLGVSESSVKRWVDEGAIAADRTAGGHRRIPLSAAIGYIRRRGASLTKPQLFPLQTPPEVGVVDAAAAEKLFNAMLHDWTDEARGIISGRFLGGSDIASIADGLIRPVLCRLGELWRDGPEGILLEHRAVDTCVHALTEIGSWIPRPPDAAPTAVTAGGPGDPYLLPPLLASLVLRERGIRVHNLGPNTTYETIGLAMSRYGARLCSISISSPPCPRVAADWRALERRAARSRGRIIVGGRCSGELPEAIRAQVRMCSSMSELAMYSTGWVEGLRADERKELRS